jgi:hypothetical protein
MHRTLMLAAWAARDGVASAGPSEYLVIVARKTPEAMVRST